MATWLRAGLQDGGLTRYGLHTGLSNLGLFNGASLDLPFADTKSLADAVTGQSLVTFTRASSGTYVDSTGTIRTATTNLQRHSEDFTQGLTPNNATLTANQGVAPNGTLTADQFLETTANGLHSQEIADHVFIAGTTYTFSCYAKSIGGRNFAPGFPTLFSSARFGFFNLSGSGSVVSADPGVTASVQAVGDGWYRCSITSTAVTGGGARVGVFIASGASISYVGDAAKGLLLWGAQLEQSSAVGEYIPTTSTINSAPRFDHNPTTGESLGLLVEESRSNLLLYSDDLDNAWWIKSNSTLTSNAIAAPDGTVTAEKFIPDNGATTLASVVSTNITKAASAISYVFSFFVKAGGFSTFLVRARDSANNANRIENVFNLSTFAVSGAVTTGTFTNRTFTYQDFGNGWYRCALGFTTGTETSINVRITGTAAETGDGTSGIYLWGAQLEAGSFPTSYIPTTTAAATRSADVASITGTAFSPWYRQDEGTVFVESRVQDFTVTNFSRIASLDRGDATANFAALVRSSAINRVEYSVFAGTGQAVGLQSPITLTGGSTLRSAFVYKTDDFIAAANGTLSPADTSGTMPTAVTTIGIGMQGSGGLPYNGTIRRLTYWPQRLPNSTLQAITQ